MKVTLITSRYPLPPWRGNQVRTLEWLDALAEHEVELICPEPGRAPSRQLGVGVRHYPLGILSRSQSLFRAAMSGLPMQEALYDSGAARRLVATAVQKSEPDLVIVQMVRCTWAAEAVWDAMRSVPVIFDSIDAMGLHFERAALNAVAPLAMAYRSEAARCRRRERILAETARFSVAVSRRDLEALDIPEDRGRVIPVAGREVQKVPDERGAPVVLLSGNLGYRPTVKGALWFARDVWPGIVRRVPKARWVMAGARPAPAIRQLAGMPGVEIHADVPDLRDYLLSARAAIAPMSSGSGVPMKVLEALAAGVPTVVHPWAADGLAAGSEDAVAVAADAAAWVDALAELLEDEGAARDLGQRGRDLWRRYYHPDVVAEQIRRVVAEAADVNR